MPSPLQSKNPRPLSMQVMRTRLLNIHLFTILCLHMMPTHLSLMWPRLHIFLT